MVDLEDLDAGQLRHPPGPVIQAGTEDHQLRYQSGADGIVDDDRTRHDRPGAGPHHLEVNPIAHPLGRVPGTHPLHGDPLVIAQRHRVSEPALADTAMRSRATLANQHRGTTGPVGVHRPTPSSTMRQHQRTTTPTPIERTRAIRKLIVSTFLTLDGVMQAPGGPGEDDSGGFAHGGWSVNYWDEQMGQVMGGAMSRPFALVLGRRTYDIFAAHWPHATDDPGAKPLNDATKYVASRSRPTLEWNNSVLIEGDAAEGIAALKQEDGPELQVHGSGNLIQTLLRHNLVDQDRLWVFPLVIGSGKRLFRVLGVIPGPTQTGTANHCARRARRACRVRVRGWVVGGEGSGGVLAPSGRSSVGLLGSGLITGGGGRNCVRYGSP